MTNSETYLPSQRYASRHRGAILNCPVVSMGVKERKVGQRKEMDLDTILMRSWFPTPRLLPETVIIPFSDPDNRFLPFPETVDNPLVYYGWRMQELIDKMIPSDQSSKMLLKPLIRLLEVAAGKYYEDDFIQKHSDDDEPPFLSCFGEIAESQATGLAFDRIYRALGNSLTILSELDDDSPADLHNLLKSRENKGRGDLDITIASSYDNHNPQYILGYWDESRKDYQGLQISITTDGSVVYQSKNFNVVERPDPHKGDRSFQGWRLVKSLTDDGTELIILQAGMFSLRGKLSTEDDLVLEKNTFSIELSAKPCSEDDIKPTDSRVGACASVVDKLLRLRLKSLSLHEMNLVTDEEPWDWEAHVNRYGRNKWYLLNKPEVFKYKSSLIEVLTRALKQASSKVGAFEVNDDNGVATAAEQNINDSLWLYVSPENWSGYLINNLLGAVHLSPFVFGAHMISSSRLDALPTDLPDERIKFAEHGIDYTLSLGQLWPNVFTNLADEQIVRFINALPHQKKYVDDYLADLERYEQTGDIHELKLEHQGVYYVMNALKAAGVKFPDFGGNLMMQFLYLFRHPMDTKIDSCASFLPRLRDDCGPSRSRT